MSNPLLACVLALASPSPDVPRPASVLVFPVHRSTPGHMTIVSVTNTSTSSDTFAFFHYVNVVEGTSPLLPARCSIFCRTELLTRADTVSVVTSCHNEGSANQGYLVVSARSATSGAPWSHDALVGSTLLIDFATGAVATVQPLPFRAVPPAGAATDLDFDGKLDFDGREYELLPDDLIVDSFLAAAEPALCLLDLSGDRDARVSVDFRIWNDNEFPLSLHTEFRCWFTVDLTSLSSVFSQTFLAGTPHDPSELDLECRGRGVLEFGWLRISAQLATRGGRTIVNPPLLGAIVPGRTPIEGGRVLWGAGTSAGEF